MGGGVFATLLVAGAIAGIVAATRGGGAGSGLPEGFHGVQARGPVERAMLENLASKSQTVRLADGRARRTRQTQEVWWNRGTGLSRTIFRNDGVVIADVVQQRCLRPHHLLCITPSPFDLRSKGFGWRPRKNSAKRVASGTFRGRRVIWIEQLVQPGDGTNPLSGDQVAYDVVTHRPIALRMIGRTGPKRFRDRIVTASAVTFLPQLAAKNASFAVPAGGAPLNLNGDEADFGDSSLAHAGDVIGRTPLWLGRVYRGHRLRSVQTGLSGLEDGHGGGAAMAPVVRLDYGAFQLDEFGETRPLYLLHAPPPGELFVDPLNLNGVYGRDGVVVEISQHGVRRPQLGFERDLARALRPAA